MPLLQRLHLSKSLVLLGLIVFSPSLLFSQISTSGYLRNYNAVLTTDDQGYLVGRNRLALNLNKQLSNGKLFISNEVLNTYTISANEYQYEFREAYFDLYLGDTDLRIGKQIINQGRTDGTFLTDILTPVDLSEYLTQDVQDIKIGIPAVKLTRYFGSNFLDVILTPIYQSNMLGRPGSRWYPFNEFEENATIVYADSAQTQTLPRLQGQIKYSFREDLRWDLDLFAMYWTPLSPTFDKQFINTGTQQNPESAILLNNEFKISPMFGYSGSIILSKDWVLKSETIVQLRRNFDYLPTLFTDNNPSKLTPVQQLELNQTLASNDDGFLHESPWIVSMIGVQTEFKSWTVATQFITEFITNHRSDLLQEQIYSYSTLLLQRSYLRDKLDVSAFGRYNYVGSDFWVNPKASYDIQDAVSLTLGAHLFSGENKEPFYGHFSFQDYQSNSFGYLMITAYF